MKTLQVFTGLDLQVLYTHILVLTTLYSFCHSEATIIFSPFSSAEALPGSSSSRFLLFLISQFLIQVPWPHTTQGHFPLPILLNISFSIKLPASWNCLDDIFSCYLSCILLPHPGHKCFKNGGHDLCCLRAEKCPDSGKVHIHFF